MIGRLSPRLQAVCMVRRRIAEIRSAAQVGSEVMEST